MVKHGAIITIVALFTFPLMASGQTINCGSGPYGCSSTNAITMTASTVTLPPPYTLVLRDKLGKTVLIRGILLNGTYTSAGSGTVQTESPKEICERIAAVLKASPDIEAADCFK